jgi:hypothetical protein
MLRDGINTLYPWVMKDSASFILRAERGEFDWPDDHDLYAVDIAKFFPNTDQAGLRRDAERTLRAAGLSEDLVKKADRMTGWLLENQYATAGDDVFFRRHRGVGMGHAAASELCDAHVARTGDTVLLGAVEAGLVRWYVRFRDDGLMCIPKDASRELFTRLTQDFYIATNGLVLEIAPLDANQAVWLDLKIRRGARNKLAFSTHIKDTNSGLYLIANSYHPRGVVENWYKGELVRYARNSTLWSDMLPLVSRLQTCLRRRGYSVNSDSMAESAKHLHARRMKLLTQKKNRAISLCPFVIPFHRMWTKLGIGSGLIHIKSVLQKIDPQIKVPVAFSNRARHLHIIVRRSRT